MIKVIATEHFTLKDFDKLKNITRINPQKDNEGELYTGDTFECDEKMADYLNGNNSLNKKVIDIVEIIPEEEKPVKKTTKKKTTKK